MLFGSFDAILMVRSGDDSRGPQGDILERFHSHQGNQVCSFTTNSWIFADPSAKVGEIKMLAVRPGIVVKVAIMQLLGETTLIPKQLYVLAPMFQAGTYQRGL